MNDAANKFKFKKIYSSKVIGSFLKILPAFATGVEYGSASKAPV